MLLAAYCGRKRILDRVIQDATGGPYSHVEIPLCHYGHGHYLCLSSSMLDGGVRLKVIDLHTDNWHLYQVRSDVTTEDVWQWYFRHAGYKYDYAGALAYRVPFLKQNPKKKYCSEVVSEVLGQQRSNHPNGLIEWLLIMGQAQRYYPEFATA